MSFMNIKNPEKRDVMIENYVATVKRLQRRNLEERSDLMDRQRDLEENCSGEQSKDGSGRN